MNRERLGARTQKAGIVLGGTPRVDLLPAEVRRHQQNLRLRRKLGTAVVGAALIAATAFAGATVLDLQAEARLADERLRTDALLAEQADYAEVIDVNRQIVLIEAARSLGTSTEVLWQRILDEYRSALPDGATITSAALTGRAPWEPEPTPAGPLRSASVAEVAITAVTPAVPDATAWLRRIAELPTIADASLNTIASVDGDWTTTVTFNVNTDGLAGRFPPADLDGVQSPSPAPSGEPVEAAEATGGNR
jgi:hypothetical protein